MLEKSGILARLNALEDKTKNFVVFEEKTEEVKSEDKQSIPSQENVITPKELLDQFGGQEEEFYPYGRPEKK